MLFALVEPGAQLQCVSGSGLQEPLTVGGAVFTVTDVEHAPVAAPARAVPVYVLLVVGVTVRVPDPAPTLPIPSITKEVAFALVVQESVVELPDVIVEGLAEKVQVGAPAGVAGCEHEALVPPFEPLQFHVHGPAEPPMLFALVEPGAQLQCVSGSGLQAPLTFTVTVTVAEQEG